MPAQLRRRMLIAAVTLATASTPSFANDWEGLSLGIGGGFGIANNELEISPGPVVSGLDGKLDINGLGGTGGFFTIGVGYDHTLLNTLVVGGFVDYDFSGIDTNVGLSIPPLSDLTASARFTIDNQLSVGGRLGYLVSPTTLFFSTFGYAHVETSDLTAKIDGVGGTLASVGSFDGYFVGGGVETMISNGFSLKAEYRYTSLQSEDATVLPGSGVSDFVSVSIKPQIQTARLSLNYRFGDGKHDKVDNSIPPITSSWTGPYIGFGGGYSAANNEVTLADRSTPPGSIFSADVDGIGSDGGFIFGTLGYDYQLSPKLVIGAFADADFSNLQHTNELDLSTGGLTLSGATHTEFNDILMVGGRLGYLTTPDTLVFASVGYASAGMDDTQLSASINGTGGSLVLIEGKRFSGVFFGGGIETKIWDSLSLKAEYRYIDLGSENMTLLPNDLPEINQVLSTKFDPTIQTGRLSLNYRFGRPAEAAAAPLK